MSDVIAVVDVGATNTRVVLLDEALKEVASRKAATRHLPGPPYKAIDHEALLDFVTRSLIELDSLHPIDTISISAFGATVALLDEAHQLVLPIMDYLAEAPARVDAEYARIAPPFSEVFSNTSPGALTIGKQLYWIETEFPDYFEKVQHVLPFSAYIAHALGGDAATEISNLGVFTHLINVKTGGWSSLVKQRGWERLFPPRRNAWDIIGRFSEPGTGRQLRGKGEILTGLHDSNANWLRYLAGQNGQFTLLSTGTFVIGFDSGADLSGLDPASDNFSFNDIFGKPIGCGRFYGGYEFDKLLDGAPATGASVEGLAAVISSGIFALPAFSDTGGPIAGRGNRGRIVGGSAEDPHLRASLATLYYALMVDRMLDGLRSGSSIILDGPAARNTLLMGLVGALRQGQTVFASELSEGTTLGAGVLGQMKTTGQLPKLEIGLIAQAPLELSGLQAYRSRWIALINEDN